LSPRKHRRGHSFVLKLKRRRIIETTGAFIGGGWLALEFVHWALIMHYHLPEKLFDLAFVTIIGIFLSTITWRWFHSHESKPKKVKVEFIFIPVIISAVVLVDFYLILQMKVPEEDLVWKTAWKNSIAVLPFDDLSPGKSQRSFCDNLTDDIITKLGNVPGLRVIARNSSSQYSNVDKPVSRMGKELNVEQVLVGTLKIEGEKVRVNVELVDTKRGFNIWGKSYNKTIESCFEVQDEIAADIAEQLKVGLTERTVPASRRNEPRNSESFKAYQWGRFFERNYRDSQKQEDFDKSVEMYEKAINLDHNCALPYFGLGSLYESRYARENSLEDLDQMDKYYKLAYEHDPDLPEVSLGLGWVYFHRGMMDLSYQNFKRAFDLDPQSCDVNEGLAAFLRSVGLYEKAIKYHFRAIDVDPLSQRHYSSCANCYWYLGEYEKAIRLIKEAVRLEPDNWRLRLNFARQLLMLQRYDEAEVEINRAERVNPSTDLLRRHKAWLLAARGEKEQALALLKQSDLPYSYEMTIIYALVGKKEEAILNIKEGIELGFQTVKDYLYCYPILDQNPVYRSLDPNKELSLLRARERARYEERKEKYSGL